MLLLHVQQRQHMLRAAAAAAALAVGLDVSVGWGKLCPSLAAVCPAYLDVEHTYCWASTCSFGGGCLMGGNIIGCCCIAARLAVHIVLCCM
jgi:hypothetical protein